LIYNSTYAGTPLTPELLDELTLEPNFVALKEGNQLQLGAVVRRLGSRISVFTARDMYICETIAVGGHGAIAYSANIAPDLALALFSAAKDGNFTLARKLQFDLIPLVLRLVSRSYPAAIKAAMNIVGLEGGTVRAPLTPLTLSEIEDLRTTLSELQSTVSPIVVGARTERIAS
jgi:4-hydroxy-tetrahydrodipicolinate synthase